LASKILDKSTDNATLKWVMGFVEKIAASNPYNAYILVTKIFDRSTDKATLEWAMDVANKCVKSNNEYHENEYYEIEFDSIYKLINMIIEKTDDNEILKKSIIVLDKLKCSRIIGYNCFFYNTSNMVRTLKELIRQKAPSLLAG
jgi:magnesium-transporting ATPase (P-type)